MNPHIQQLNFPLSLNFSSFRLKTKTLRLLLWLSILLTFSFLSFYLFQVAKLTETNYLIKTYNQKVGKLTKENSRLENRYNQLTSLVELEKRIENLNLVKVSEVNYLSLVNQLVQKEEENKKQSH